MGSSRWISSMLASLGAISAIAFATPLHADATDADAVRISAAGHSLNWNWTPPGHTERFGHGETLIHAPLAQVRRTVLDFGRYKTLGPDIKTSRVVGREPDGSTDVYIRIGVLNDLISFWNITRFAPLRHEAAGAEVLEGKMLPGKGNIDDSVIMWTMHSAGDDWTVLKFDALLRPGVPAPQSLIDNTLRESALHTVESVRDLLQGAAGVQPYTG